MLITMVNTYIFKCGTTTLAWRQMLYVIIGRLDNEGLIMWHDAKVVNYDKSLHYFTSYMFSSSAMRFELVRFDNLLIKVILEIVVSKL